MPKPAAVPDELVLHDARSVRALAHPVRLAVIDALYSGEVLTATELAHRTGTTASAMSYHLRHLASFGLVRRAADRGDARERPWERTAKDLHVDVAPEAPLAVAATTRLMMQESVRRDLDGLLAAASAQRGGSSSHYSRARVFVTEEEFRAALGAIQRILDDFQDRGEDERPAGAYPVLVSVMAWRDPSDGSTDGDSRIGE